MRRVALTLMLLATFAAGYSVGVIRASVKARREDALKPAMLAVGTARAREEGNARRAEELAQLQLRSAIDGAAGLGQPGWAGTVIGSLSNAQGYENFAAVIAAHLRAHPEIAVDPATRAYFARYAAVTTPPTQGKP